MPRITVVVPSLNQGAYLDAALGSLREQDYPDLEIIVVDGGSDDDSVAVIERHAAGISWWRSAPDGGQAQALNEGFAHASGDILGWLCADDLLAPGALQSVAQAFAAHDAELVTARSAVVTERGTRVPWERLRWCDARDMLLTGCTWSQPATFWRRRLWDAVGGVDDSLHFTMDYDLWLRFCALDARIHYLDRIVAYERRHRAQKTTALNYERLRSEKLVVRRRAAAARGYGGLGFLLRSLAYRRLIALSRSTRNFLGLDPGIERWHAAALGFARTQGTLDYLRLVRRWLAAICFSDADEHLLLRETLCKRCR